MKLILASASPRRKELMQDMNYAFDVIVSNCEEVFREDIPFSQAIEEVAYQKAYDVWKEHQDSIVIGCDTMVVYKQHKLGKPKNRQDAKEMLQMLSGNTHEVVSGVCVLSKQQCVKFHEITKVNFYSLDDKMIEAYLDTLEYKDKAGSYGIQGIGKILVQGIEGDYFNVVGLPFAKLYRELQSVMEQADIV